MASSLTITYTFHWWHVWYAAFAALVFFLLALLDVLASVTPWGRSRGTSTALLLAAALCWPLLPLYAGVMWAWDIIDSRWFEPRRIEKAVERIRRSRAGEGKGNG